MTSDSYSALLIASYGGPDKPDDVLPFMRNATAGKNIPDERLVEVSQHYMMFGGKSPINELNTQLREALAAELSRRGRELPVVVGNRNWHPYIGDVVEELATDGHRRVLAVATSAYQSYSSCRQYHEDIAGAAKDQPVEIDKLDPFWDAPGFAHANTRSLVTAVRAIREQSPQGRLKVLFVTHSIPTTMNELSATGEPAGRYEAQHLRVAREVASAAEQELGEPLDWELTFCSRSGPPHIPWLEPDVNDRMEDLSGEVDAIVAAPIGFISDHMEVLYDLDTEARATAERLGLDYHRAATVGVDPEFISMLVDRIVARLDGQQPQSICQFASGACCLPRQTTPTRKEHHGSASV